MTEVQASPAQEEGKTGAAEMRHALEAVESWLFGGAICSAEDFAQGIPHMTDLVRTALQANREG